MSTEPARLRSSTETIRDTTKWLIAIVTALASVLVGGIRFGDVGSLQIASSDFLTVVFGLVMALTGIGIVLVFATRVLSSRYDSFVAVLQRSEQAEEKKPSFPAHMTDKLMKAIAEERNFLYGDAEVDSLEAIFRDLRRIDETLAGVRQSEDPLKAAEEIRLRERRKSLIQGADRVIDFAEHWTTKQRFGTLQRSLVIGTVLTSMGAFVFAMGINHANSSFQIDRPIAVRVFLTSSGQALAHKEFSCSIKSFEGYAVGGTMEAPLVVSAPTSQCREASLNVTSDLGVAVPVD